MLVKAVELEPLKEVTVTCSVSKVTLHVWENQKIFSRPMASAAKTHEEQLALSNRDDTAVRLGDEVIVLGELEVLFVNDTMGEEATANSIFSVPDQEISMVYYLTGRLTPRSKD